MLVVPSLVAGYDFDGNPNDFSGNGLDATVYNANIFDGGPFGRYYNLNNTDHSYIDLGWSRTGDIGLFCDETETWSVGMWFKVAYNAGGSIICKGASVVANRVFQIHFEGYTSRTYAPFFVIRGNLVGTALELDDDQWHHIMVTWDYSIAKLYIDGAYYDNIPVGTAADDLLQNVLIGGIDNGTYQWQAWNGNVASVVFFNCALNQSDVSRVMMNTHPIADDKNTFISTWKTWYI
ncbi:MAG: LamG-like jellyroll fold domain-containing protein, partial [Bacilli bacterium]